MGSKEEMTLQLTLMVQLLHTTRMLRSIPTTSKHSKQIQLQLLLISHQNQPITIHLPAGHSIHALPIPRKLTWINAKTMMQMDGEQMQVVWETKILPQTLWRFGQTPQKHLMPVLPLLKQEWRISIQTEAPTSEFRTILLTLTQPNNMLPILLED